VTWQASALRRLLFIAFFLSEFKTANYLSCLITYKPAMKYSNFPNTAKINLEPFKINFDRGVIWLKCARESPRSIYVYTSTTQGSWYLPHSFLLRQCRWKFLCCIKGWLVYYRKKNYKVTRRSVPSISLQYQLPRSPFFETLYCYRGTESGCSFCNTQWLLTCYLRVNKFSLFLASIDKWYELNKYIQLHSCVVSTSLDNSNADS
jgi:hypothetical protein